MKTDKIAILGSGNIGLALANGLVKGNYCKATQIILTRRNIQSLAEYKTKGFETTDNNSEAVKNASVIILGVLPQQLKGLLAEIENVITPEHVIVSIISGVTCTDIRK
jgi:pyrroline-5-carboxylate reductase